jgi:endonuclease/exonuclease/phosphatase family metal-dependent hydrolase
MGYGLGLNGSVKDYALKWYRYIYLPKKIRNSILKQTSSLIKNTKPDLCCFIEFDSSHARYFKHSHHTFSNKYGDGLLSRLPVFSRKTHAVFSKNKIKAKKHYFKHGLKKLIYEIPLPKGITLYFTHFALLSGKTRKEQFKEIKKLISQKKKVIVCGDFNIFKGHQELIPFLKETNLKSIGQNNKTFPAHRPKSNVDIFLCSKNLKVKQCRVINKKLSDHLPVLLEIKP